jgi:gluconolactonase
MKHQLIAIIASVAALVLSPAARAADDLGKLSAIFIAGEDWQVVSEGHGFVDGPSCDAEGNLYFSDLKSKPPGLFKITPDGKKTKIADVGRSGTKIGADGRLYAVGEKKLWVYTLPDAKETMITDDLSTNDLAVSHDGLIFLTETGKKQVTFVNIKTGEKKPADVGITKPNGIAFSPDQKTLYVSDYGGLNVWSFAVQPDGTLTDKKAAMTMKAPESKPTVAGGDGMITDTLGRAYVTSALGIQIFEPTGELIGILPKPGTGPLTSVTFAGAHREYLYATCGEKLLRRRTQAQGAASFEQPSTK